jgi:hypothetical protein
VQQARKTDPVPAAAPPPPARPELHAIDGGLHLPGSELIEEALARGATRTRRALRATALAAALGFVGLALSTAISDAAFVTLGVAGAAAAAGAFLARESGLLRLASGLRALTFLLAVLLVFSGALIGAISLL